jgi:putative FmdB family regulatory protein
MVIREYFCKSCGIIEAHQSIHEAPLTNCPTCEKPIKQIFRSIPEIVWKGRFKWMGSEPEVDIEKIEAEQDREALKQAKGKVHRGLSESNKKFY